MRTLLFASTVVIAATVAATPDSLSAQRRSATPSQNAVTVCEDGGGVGWWRPAKDLLEMVQNEIATSGEISESPQRGSSPEVAHPNVRPPVRVSDVKLVETIEHAPRLCATFTEMRVRPTAAPQAIKLLVSESITYCQISANHSWEVGLTKILENLANGDISQTLTEDTPLFVFDPGTRDFTAATGRRGERVRIGGRYVTDIELLPNENEQPSVCVSFGN
jgi:hypothetical protein